MNLHQQMVFDFMVAMEQPTPTQPSLDDYPRELRTRLILEEAFEFVEACGLHIGEVIFSVAHPYAKVERTFEPDWVEMIDALCDLLYVTYGAAVAMGVDLEPFYAEVHRANLAKSTGPVRADGKRGKPEGWTPPDIAGILARLRG